MVGFVDSDLLLTVNNGLLLVMGVGPWFSLKDQNPGLVALAMVLGAVGSGDKTVLLAAGQELVLRWQGTAFDAYYVLTGVALILVAVVMLGSPTLGRKTALWGLGAGVLMVVSSTASTLGLVCSLLSLVPWSWFAFRVAKVFFRLSQVAP